MALKSLLIQLILAQMVLVAPLAPGAGKTWANMVILRGEHGDVHLVNMYFFSSEQEDFARRECLPDAKWGLNHEIEFNHEKEGLSSKAGRV
jgi:hypothetical protein